MCNNNYVKNYIIRYLPVSEIRIYFKEIVKFISEERREKMESYKDENDKLLSLGAAYFIHKYLKDEIYYNEYNKPYSKNGFFNISHSSNYVVFIMCDYECGIDIEKRDKLNFKLVDYSFNNEIKSKIDSIDSFNKYWTLKEALAKSTGYGLSIDEIKNIPSEEGLIYYKNKYYITKSIDLYGYKIGISIETKEDYTLELIEEKIV